MVSKRSSMNVLVVLLCCTVVIGTGLYVGVVVAAHDQYEENDGYGSNGNDFRSEAVSVSGGQITSTELGTASSLTGNVNSGGHDDYDEDWFKFSPPETEFTLTVQSDPNQEGDIGIEVENESGDIVNSSNSGDNAVVKDFDDDGTDETVTQVSVTGADTSATYYLKLYAYDDPTNKADVYAAEDCGRSDDGSSSCDGNYELYLSYPPTADAVTDHADANVLEGAAVSFDGSGTSDPDDSNSALTFSWAFGDGSGSGETPTHTFSTGNNGGTQNYTPELTVTDSGGGQDTDTTKQLTVYSDFDEDGFADIDNPSPSDISGDTDDDDDGISDSNDPAKYNVYPTASDSSSESTDDNSTLSISNGDSADLTELATDGGKSYDPNTDSISIEKVDGESFSAGSAVSLASGATVTVADDGSWDYDPNGTYKSLGSSETATDEFNYTVSDDPHSGTTAATDQGTVSITINGLNQAPTDPTDDNVGTNAVAEDRGTDASVSINATSSDAEGDVITWSLADNASGRFQINQSGVVTVDNASKVDYESADNHDYTITVDATDGSASSTTDFTVNVTDVDETPSFSSDTSATAYESNSTDASVLDVNADIGGSDDEGVGYQFTSGNDDVAGNGGGAFAIDSSGQITISDTEDIDESQQSSFSLDVKASEGSQSNTTTVNIAVNDDAAPAFQSGSSRPADGATDHLPSDDINLSFDEDVSLGTGTIKIVDEGDDSSTKNLDVTTSEVTVSGSNITLSPSNHLESDTNYHVEIDGTTVDDTFSNSYGGIADSTTYNFKTADTDPSFTGSSPSVSVDEDGSVDLTSSLEVKDVAASDTLTWSVASAPGDGNLSGINNSESVSGANSPHTLSTSPTYTPDADFVGSDSFDVDINDTNPGFTTDTITVSVTVDPVNDPPSFSLPASPNQSVGNDTSQQKTSSFIDTSTFDPGGGSDESSQSIDEFPVSNDNNTLFTSQPHIDTGGDLTYTPADGVEGTATVDVQVRDDNGTSNGGNDTSGIRRFNITVDNLAPSVSSLSVSNPSGQDVAVSFDSDEQLSTINVSISGAESATLTQSNFTETDNNGSYTYDATYSGSSDGEYTASIRSVEDTAGNNATSNLSLGVTIDTTDPGLGSDGAGLGGIDENPLESDDGETILDVQDDGEGTGEGDGDGTEDGAGDGEAAGGPTPDMTVTVNDPQPGQTLVIDGSGASIVEQAAPQQDDTDETATQEDEAQEDEAQEDEAQEDETEEDTQQDDTQQGAAADGTSQGSGADGGSGSSASNVRANQLSVDIDTDSDFQLSMTTYENDLTPSSAVDAGAEQSSRVVPLARGASMLKVTTASARTGSGLAPDEVEAAARSFENQTGTVPAGYIQINTSLRPEEVADATVVFSIRRAYLDELGVDPGEVTLYHHVADDEWETRETTHIDTDGTYHYFEGSVREFSVFALGTSASILNVSEASLEESTIESDETATVTATVTNRGATTRETTVELTIDGDVVEAETVTVEGGDTADVTFSVAPGAPGEHELAVGPIDLDGLTVEAADEETTATQASTESDAETPAGEEVDGEEASGEASDDSGLQISPVAVLGLLVAVLLVAGPRLRRISDRHVDHGTDRRDSPGP